MPEASSTTPCKNALDASPDKGLIELALVREPDHLALSCRNQGAVPQAIRKRFFEKFVTHGKSTGTGMGTYFIKRFIETMGGQVRLDIDDAAQTTTISLRFPPA